ncbi:MAG: hypothetical protein KAJ81_07245 [Candidatus Latescibacteria bacterium]|nr:hypothetical protein [Candidatus Latescibacterota bacterium]
MFRILRILIPGLLLLIPAFTAAAKPDMSRQDTWGEKEKEEFYRWLKQNTTSAEETQLVNTTPFEQMQGIPGTLSDNYFSLRAGTYGLFGFALEEETDLEESGEIDGSLRGLDLQLGKPIKTWFRRIYNAGFYKGSVDQKLNGGAEIGGDFSLYRLGVHLELALVPLGHDQTRNIILRGGLDLLYGHEGNLIFVAEGDSLSLYRRDRQKIMLDQVSGLQAGLSWSLGYEWQLGENFWRVHGMLDGFRAIHLTNREDRENYAVLGGFIGISRVF